MRWIKSIFWAVVVAIIVVFFIQNLQSLNQTIYLNFNCYFWGFSVNLPLYLLIIFSFLLGVLFAVAYTFKGWWAKSRQLKLREKEMEQLKKELDELRNLPLRETPATDTEAK